MDALWEAVHSLTERCHRLEIRNHHLEEKLQVLYDAQERLRGRLDGSRGGRPVKGPAATSVDQVPFGDKRALRVALGVNPPSRPPQE